LSLVERGGLGIGIGLGKRQKTAKVLNKSRSEKDLLIHRLIR
jgi:hypothetical protein